MEVDSKLQQAA